MTVESAITKVMYQGNSSAREWPVPFEFSRAEDIRLLLSDESGTESEVAENYQVQVNESGDTSVIYPVAGQSLPPGAKLVIYRQTPLSQIVDLIYGGAFSPDTLERDGLDRAVMMIQELQEEVDRAVKIPITSEETPESVLGDIYGARDDAADSATAAALSATNAKQSEDNAKGSAVVAEDARERACQCADRAEEARDVAIGQAQATNLLMETEVAKINTIIGADADGRKLAVEKARRWAEGEPGVPVDMDDDGNPKYSARHWANEASEISIPAASSTQRGGAILSDSLDGTRQAADAVAASEWALAQVNDKAAEAQETADEAKAAAQMAMPLGDIQLKPFRFDELPPGWHFCNGDLYPIGGMTTVGGVLASLSDNYKTDWGITVTGSNISIPNMFYTDGRGYFLRSVDGTTFPVGSIQNDAIRNISGNVGSTSTPGSPNGVFSSNGGDGRTSAGGTGGLARTITLFNAASVVPTAEENRPLNIGMTPAIFLGV